MQAGCNTFMILMLLHAGPAWAQGEPPAGTVALNAWLEHQKEVKTWTADVTQTRKLKAVKRSLTTPGRIWFVGHRQFRWELGKPIRTQAFRREHQLLVLYPQLQRAEKYEFSSEHDPGLQQARLLMDVGFPAEPNEFHSQYELLGHSETQAVHRFKLQPRVEKARAYLTELNLQVRHADWALLATEMLFPDGSTLSNVFTEHRFNVTLPADILEPDLEGYTLEEPLKGR